MSDEVSTAKRAFAFLLDEHLQTKLGPEVGDFVRGVVSGRMGGGSVKPSAAATVTNEAAALPPAKKTPAKAPAQIAGADKPKRPYSRKPKGGME